MTLMGKSSKRINTLICAKIWCAGSNHYLELILEHSTPDFSTNYSDDYREETSIDYHGLEHVAIIDG